MSFLERLKTKAQDPAFQRAVLVISALALVKFAPRIGIPIDQETANEIVLGLSPFTLYGLSMAPGSQVAQGTKS